MQANVFGAIKMKLTDELKKLISSQSFMLVVITYAIVLLCTFISLYNAEKWSNEVCLPKLIDAILPTTITLALPIIWEIQTSQQSDKRIVIASFSFLLLYTLSAVLFSIRALKWSDELVENFMLIIILSIVCITCELYFLHNLKNKKAPSAK
jgi:hypothetical protein